MSAIELIARSAPAPGAPSELAVLAWMVGGFWALVAAILFALWYARKRRSAHPEIAARAEHEHREHVAFVEGLHPGHGRKRPAIMRGEGGRVILYPELAGVARTAGRRRRKGKRRLS